MATVTVVAADKVYQIEAASIVSGEIDENGDIILNKAGGDIVNLGNVKDHSQLTGLNEDDHDQYALADGSRGDFRRKVGEIIELLGSTGGLAETFIVVHDETDSANWDNRLEFKFRDQDGTPDRRVTYINEVGELRVAAAKHNTVAARFFAKEFPGNPVQARNPDIPIVEVMDDRVNRNSLWGVLVDGTVTTVNNIKTAQTIVLGAEDPVPVGTPPNTVIVRTA